MEENLNLIFSIGGTIFLLALGFVVGTLRENAHFRSLEAREKTYSGIMVTDLRTLPANWNADQGTLVQGEVVIASDYFKGFAASLRNLVGGRVGVYEKLMDRARREAMLRMLYQARVAGANVVWNIRYETSTVGRGPSGGSSGAPMAEVFVYGTAYRVTDREG
ncbi:MAG: heavy metal-binding domain-containing protein [Armatimonadetes bacterium]|nr:heavy metal-binding domain-containing protein [Armatimonadota bacterium]